jgi:hypothetical protein
MATAARTTGWVVNNQRILRLWRREDLRVPYRKKKHPLRGIGVAFGAMCPIRPIVGCLGDEVEGIRSLGKTLKRWRTEILNNHRTGASNGPTKGLNLCLKKVKRCDSNA